MQKKYAFTMFETLIVVAITAILVLLSFKTFKTVDEKAYSNLYAKAFNTLNTATYNIQADVDDYNNAQDLMAQENEGKAGADDSKKKRFPYVDCSGDSCEATEVTEGQLCSALVTGERSYINIVGSASCNIYTMEDFTNADEPPETPSFKTTDGMNYYLVASPNAKYFVIWVDMTGDRAPNLAKYIKGKKKPDIVPFSIYKETGVVTPLGYPIYDASYMTARVISSDPELDVEYSIPMTYSEARALAFSNYTWTVDHMSYSMDSYFEDTLPDDFVKPNADGSIATKLGCSDLSGYRNDRDFPPCTVEVSTFIRK